MAVRRVVTRNSVYEIDESNNRARRVSGINPPVHKAHIDGEWYPTTATEWLPFGSLLIQFESGLSLITSALADSPAYVD